MANTLGFYNPQFYANEALMQLESAMGMALRIHRGYDAERRSFGKGDTINITRPGKFTVADAPATAEDLSPESVTMTLANWKEVKFKLTDKELAYTQEKIIDDHIRPAAVALADHIDTALSGLYSDVGWQHKQALGPASVADLVKTRKVMFDNKVPLREVGRVHLMIDGETEADYLALPAFSEHQGAGDTGVATQLNGTLGTKFGVEVFANQNVQVHTPGTASVTALLTNGAATKGATTLNLDFDSAVLTRTVVPGDTFVIAGNTQRYAVTNTVTAAGNALAAVGISPALQADVADGVAVTLRQQATLGSQIAFHRNAFALAMAPLSTMGNELGARIATITDPITGLSLRSRVYYVGNSSEVHVALDVLYGIKTLDPNLAVIMENHLAS